MKIVKGSSLVTSYKASKNDIPTKVGDQVAAIECLYFVKQPIT